VSVLLLALGISVAAQTPKKTWRVGYVAAVSAAADAPRLEAFRQGLRELGYVEGQNIVIEYRHEGGGFERLPELVAELIRQKPDVLVAVRTNAALATGITNIAAILTGKRLELLKETIPALSRVAVLWDPNASGSVPQWQESHLRVRELGLQLYSVEVSSVDNYEATVHLFCAAYALACSI
jgi:putative ABC transport system substrate-binding protein